MATFVAVDHVFLPIPVDADYQRVELAVFFAGNAGFVFGHVVCSGWLCVADVCTVSAQSNKRKHFLQIYH